MKTKYRKTTFGSFALLVFACAFFLLLGCGGGSSNGGGGAANTAPTADAGQDTNANELAVVNLDGSQSSDTEDGIPASFLWEQVVGAGDPVVTINNANSAVATFTAPVVAGQTPLTFRLTVTDSDGADDSDEVTVVVENTAFLSGSEEAPPVRVNLGSLDWVHRGLSAAGDINRKSGVTQQISDVSPVGGAGGPTRITDSPIAYSWTDGTPDNPVTDTTTGIFFLMPNTDNSDIGKGYSLTVDADTTPRTLQLYLGAFQAEGRLVASLPGVPDLNLLISNEFGVTHRLVTITFMAQTSGQQLTVTFTMENDFGTQSNLNFQAAVLEAVAKPTISPPGGVFTDSVQVTLATDTPGAEIRYTLNDTQPDLNSTLFTSPFTLTSTGNTIVRAKAFLLGNGSPEASANFTINASAGGSLSAFVDLPPASVDLTSQGSLDWLHRGLSAAGDINRKSGVTQQISNVSPVGGPGGPFRFDNSLTSYSWTDGTPVGAEPGITAGIFFAMPNTDGSDIGKGYSLTVAAGTSTKTLQMYLGAFQGEARLVASLSDASAPDVNLLISNEFGITYRVVTITFKTLGSAPQSLDVEFTLNDDFGTQSNINFQGATLN